MRDITFDIFLIIVLLAVMVVYATYLVAMRLWQRSKWQTVAEELGLNFRPGGIFGEMSISGTLHGVSVAAHSAIRCEVSAMGTTRRVDTFVQAPLDKEMMPAGFGLGSKKLLDTLLSSPDIDLGGLVVDEQLCIKADDDESARALLQQPEVYETINRAARSVPEIHIYQHIIEASRRSWLLLGDALRDRLEHTARVAAALSEATERLRSESESPPRQPAQAGSE